MISKHGHWTFNDGTHGLSQNFDLKIFIED